MIHFLMEIDMYCNQYLISKCILQYYNTTINPSLTIFYNFFFLKRIYCICCLKYIKRLKIIHKKEKLVR